jgi:hypothetical protein
MPFIASIFCTREVGKKPCSIWLEPEFEDARPRVQILDTLCTTKCRGPIMSDARPLMKSTDVQPMRNDASMGDDIQVDF